MSLEEKGRVVLIRGSYQFKKKLNIYQKIHPVLYYGKLSDIDDNVRKLHDINIVPGSGYTHYIIYDPSIDKHRNV